MKLALHNFRKHRNLIVNFDVGSTIIKGKNGSGKSTIFDALLWLLYKCIQKPCSWDTDNCSVALEDETFDSLIVIHRTKSPNKVVVHIDDRKYEDEQAEGIIHRLYGSKQLFLSTTLVRQKCLHPMFELSLKDKLDILCEISMKDDQYVNLINESIPEEIRIVRSKLQELGKQLVSLNAKKEQFEKHHEHYISLKYNEDFDLDFLSEKLEIALLDLKRFDTELRSAIVHQDRHKHITSVIDNLSEDLRMLVESLNNLQAAEQVDIGAYENLRVKLLLMSGEYSSIEEQYNSIKLPRDITEADIELLKVEIEAKENKTHEDYRYRDVLKRVEMKDMKELSDSIDMLNAEIIVLTDNIDYRFRKTMYDMDVIKFNETKHKYEADSLEYDREMIKYNEEYEKYIEATNRYISLLAAYNDSLLPKSNIKGITGVRISRCPYCDEDLLCLSCKVPVGIRNTKIVIAATSNNNVKIDKPIPPVHPIKPVKPVLNISEPVEPEIPACGCTSDQDLNSMNEYLYTLKSRRDIYTSAYNEAISLEGTESNGNLKLAYLGDVLDLQPIKDYITIVEKYRSYPVEELESIGEQVSDMHKAIKAYERYNRKKSKLNAKISVKASDLCKYTLKLENSKDCRPVADIDKDIETCEAIISYCNLHIDGYEIWREYQNVTSEINNVNRDIQELELDLISLDEMTIKAKEAECMVLDRTVDAINLELSKIINKMFDEPITVEIKLNKKLRNIRSSDDPNRPGFRFKVVYNGRKSDSLIDLSPGQERKVNAALYVALSSICNTRFILLDESLIYVDSDIRVDTMSIIRELCEDKLIVVIDHDLPISDFDNVIDMD